MVVPFLPDPEKLTAVRDAIPALAAGIYLNTGSVGPLPAETAAAMAEFADRERDVGRGHPADEEDAAARVAEARAGVAAVLGADVDGVLLTHGAAEVRNATALLLGLGRSGQTDPGIVVDPAVEGDDERMLAAFDEVVTSETRLVSIPHVRPTTGSVLPVAAIAALAHARGALVVVDGAQAAGAIPFRFDELGADLYTVPAEKWLLGPEGLGAVVGTAPVLERLGPILEPADGSSFHRPSIVGMARSIGWLSMYVGLDFVHRRGTATARATAARLAGIPGVTVLTPDHAMATLVTFRIAGWSAQAALDELGARTFVIARTIVPLDAIRLSVGFFNSDEELERVAEAVALLAAHTPETLPARRVLTILGEG